MFDKGSAWLSCFAPTPRSLSAPFRQHIVNTVQVRKRDAKKCDGKWLNGLGTPSKCWIGILSYTVAPVLTLL